MKTRYVRRKLYEGNNKIIYQTNKEDLLIQFFKDTIILENNDAIQVAGKGIINNHISAWLMDKMNSFGLTTHFVKKLNMREQLIQPVEILPVEIALTNIAYGKYVKHFGLDEGHLFKQPVIEFYTKNVLVNEQQLLALKWLTDVEILELRNQAIRVNDFISGLLLAMGLKLVDCRLKFGRVYGEEEAILVLADDITPDNCCIWDLHNQQVSPNYEDFKTNPEGAISCYQTIAQKLKS